MVTYQIKLLIQSGMEIIRGRRSLAVVVGIKQPNFKKIWLRYLSSKEIRRHV